MTALLERPLPTATTGADLDRVAAIFARALARLDEPSPSPTTRPKESAR